MNSSNLTPSELRKAAYKAIARELGYSGLIRFMQDIEKGTGDYTKDRHKWLPKGDLKTIVENIKKRQRKKQK